MASIPPPKRSLRPRNVTKSYKNTCGAPAPRTSLRQSSGVAAAKLISPKNLTKPIRTGGDLVYTIKGPKLPLAAVGNILFFYLLCLKMI